MGRIFARTYSYCDVLGMFTPNLSLALVRSTPFLFRNFSKPFLNLDFLRVLRDGATIQSIPLLGSQRPEKVHSYIFPISLTGNDS